MNEDKKSEIMLSEVKEILSADILVGHDQMDLILTGGAAGDLMSDLLRNPREGALLLTGLTNTQTIRTAVVAGMAAVVIVRGKKPNAEMLEHAKKHNLPLLSTLFNMYSSCGRLYKHGLRSIR